MPTTFPGMESLKIECMISPKTHINKIIPSSLKIFKGAPLS